MLNQVNSLSRKNVENLKPVTTDRIKEKADFISRVGSGLTPIELDILILRYVYNETFGTIAKELRLIGVETVVRIHNETLKKLKEKLNK